MAAGAAVAFGDECWSFRDIDELSNAFARHLAARGVRPGERVAVMASNRPEFLVVVMATSKLGAAPVLLSTAWRALEVGHAVDLTTPVHAVVEDAGASPLLSHLSPAHVTDLEDRSAVHEAFGHSRSPLGEVAVDEESRGGARLQLGDDRPAKGGPAHPPLHPVRHRPLVRGPRSRTTRTAFRSPPRRPTSSVSSTFWPPRRPVPPCACIGGSTSTRCSAASSPNG